MFCNMSLIYRCYAAACNNCWFLIGRVEILSEFQTFLSKSGKFSEDKIKYYIYWRQRFLKFCKYQSEDINLERITQYLDSLEADQSVADWQVKQAADAVITYVELCLKKQLRSPVRGDSDNMTRKVSPAWKRTLEDTRDTIRLRQAAIRCDTVLPPICLKRAIISWLSRSCLATRTSIRR
jgi:hypothetical protein